MASYKSVHMSEPSDEERSMIDLLLKSGQGHIFENWKENENEDLKRALIAQCIKLNKICDGGLPKYISTCKTLLQHSASNSNPLKGWTPSIPPTFKYDFATEDFNEIEMRGLECFPRTAFVLVAGGLGERLKYNGIKLALTCNLMNEDCFFEHYAKFLLAYQRRARKISWTDDLKIPLAIMTSDDTHSKTQEMLSKNNFFGLEEDQITLLKQEKVPAVSDHSAKISMSSDFEICTKPHGHGDVHSLLLNSVVEKWKNAGVDYIVFFQDTNLLIFRAIPSLLGSSVCNQLDMNFLVVPRRSGEAVGSICTLTEKKTGRKRTANVEYNQFESILKSEGIQDLKDTDGYSSFPGNVNVFVVRMDKYLPTMRESGGRMPEYINPKYSNKEKGIFKSPARLECAMSDYSVLLAEGARVGCTQLPRWLCFSAAKNSLEDAASKYAMTGYSESASSAEADLYALHRNFLENIGCTVERSGKERVFAGLKFPSEANIMLEPSFGVTLSEIEEKFERPRDVFISSRSFLILSGEKLKVRDLWLDGAMVVNAGDKEKEEDTVVLHSVSEKNAGWSFENLEGGESEDLNVRGYRLVKKSTCTKNLL